MNDNHTTSTTAVQLVETEDDALVCLDASFHYDPADPFAVTMVVDSISGPVRWTFARELILNGMYEPTGDGDVHVWPCLDNDAHSVVMIELCSPDGEALVQARTAEITSFVERMTAAVAPGSEATHLDIDSAIAAIFAAEAA